MDAPIIDVSLLLKAWERRVVIGLDAHYDASRYYIRRNYWIGIPAVTFATIVGTTVFATLEKEVQLEARIAVGLLSIGAAVLSGLQTFLGYSEKSEKHRVIGARYGAIAREIEQLMTVPSDHWIENRKALDLIRKQIDAIALEAPSLPDRLWAEAKTRHPKEY